MKISASFWKGTGMTRKDQFGKSLLSCRYLLTRELSPDFLIAVLQLPHVPSRKCAHGRLAGGVCHRNFLVNQHRSRSILTAPYFAAQERGVLHRFYPQFREYFRNVLIPIFSHREVFSHLHPQYQRWHGGTLNLTAKIRGAKHLSVSHLRVVTQGGEATTNTGKC